VGSVSPDELDELEDLMEVTVVKKEGGQTDAAAAAAVKGLSGALRQRLAELHRLLKEGGGT
jgi:hypothetical protein